jgi:hypothetical protein
VVVKINHVSQVLDLRSLSLTIKGQLLHFAKNLLGLVPRQLQVSPGLQELFQVRIEGLVHVVKDKLQQKKDEIHTRHTGTASKKKY